MSSVHNSVETVNAAATAIVTAESRVQPSTVQKRRWGSCWSIYWCFGCYKHNKRIGHAVVVSEAAAAPITESRSHPSTIVLPFIAPPSSPASFLPSATQSPAGLLSLAVHAHSPAPMFTIGPYAHETQLVSPPVFSAFTTEPSTACFTPPPEVVQMTTPSSPEVPFAQLLSSNRRNLKYNLSQYEFQPYQYPGSPGGHIKSPGSTVSTSGTSSPFPDKRPPIMEFPNYKWDSRVGSGSLTPNGWDSRLGTPPSLANSEEQHKSQNDHLVVDPRVSFELLGEDIPTCVVREATNVSAVTNKKDSAPGMEEEEIHQKPRTISLGSTKEFNFNNAKGGVSVSEEIGPRNSWSFFPMLQSGAS